MYTVFYYKKLQNQWLKGKVRNLSYAEALKYIVLLSELFETHMLRIQKEN